jgi:hypothetical protein
MLKNAHANYQTQMGGIMTRLSQIVNLQFVQDMVFTVFDNEQRNLDGGVYRMHDENGKIIYVGKSSDLHTRLHNHLAKRNHTAYFMDEVKYIDWFLEPNPIYESLLESILIAYHKPKYNDEIKDYKKKFSK